MNVRDNYIKVRKEIPSYVKIVLAAKTRATEEIEEAISAGAVIIGENYIQEAVKAYNDLGRKAGKIKWHFIGKLQKNKINKALKIFDTVQTIDSYEIARVLNRRAEGLNKTLAVFIEINIGNEITKQGVNPDYETVKELAIEISQLKYLKLEGLMTMGPLSGNPESVRPYFKMAKDIFERIKKLQLPNVRMKYLSMGMSNSYRAAIDEGANIVRLGTAVFGKRLCDKSDRRN